MSLTSISPRTGERGPWVFDEAAPADVAHAAGHAAAAAPVWRALSSQDRARYLRAVADRLEAQRAVIVAAADFEAGLGEPRFNGELDRTTAQLRMFAELIEQGTYVEAIISRGDATATPPRADIRRMLVPIGPVGVFTPSNFPLAFGVAGGDTASALAAGCPVVVKGHPSHPRTSELCAEAFSEVATMSGVPRGVVTLVQSRAPEVSRALVQAPEMRAIAFTGSLTVGRLLHDLAAARPDPIPFYGELGSTNPLFIGLEALHGRAEAIADGFAASMTLGSGQFCTKPGLVFVPRGDAGDRWLGLVADRLRPKPAQVLLNGGLCASLARTIATTVAIDGVRELTTPGEAPASGAHAMARLFATDVDTFFAHPELAHEHFGPAAIAIRCDASQMAAAAARLEGQLTATIHAEAGDVTWAHALLDVLADRVGRVVWNGFPTGVAVVAAMQHGGPYPASTTSLHTSVGTTAIRRFLRPVAFQNVPDELLPPALQEANPLGIQRSIDGGWVRA